MRAPLRAVKLGLRSRELAAAITAGYYGRPKGGPAIDSKYWHGEVYLSITFATVPENDSFFDAISPSTNSAVRGATGALSGIRTHTD